MPDSSAATSTVYHASAPLGLVAIIFTVLFGAGLFFVMSFGAGRSNFPGPWESADTIVTYFQMHSWPVLMCAFFQFGAAIALGEFTVSTMSRLRFFGVNASGAYRALWRSDGANQSRRVGVCLMGDGISRSGAEQRRSAGTLLFSHRDQRSRFRGADGDFHGGCVHSGMKLLPKWIVIFGLILAGIGALSWFGMIFPKTCFLIPLTIFPGVIWMIAAGFAMPRTADRST